MVGGSSSGLQGGPGGPYDGDMEQRIAHLEGRFDGLEKQIDARFAHVDARLDQVNQRFQQVDSRFDQMDRRLDRIENKIPSKWDMAQVVFFVSAALMAAAIFGPRLSGMLPTPP
jgi:uncharacterized coiled-coil protein SlyX